LFQSFPVFVLLVSTGWAQVNDSIQVRMQFRAEFFNALNHSNFGTPGAIVFSGTAISSRLESSPPQPARAADSTRPKDDFLIPGLTEASSNPRRFYRNNFMNSRGEMISVPSYASRSSRWRSPLTM
jgi:hypothetical protein